MKWDLSKTDFEGTLATGRRSVALFAHALIASEGNELAFLRKEYAPEVEEIEEADDRFKGTSEALFRRTFESRIWRAFEQARDQGSDVVPWHDNVLKDDYVKEVVEAVMRRWKKMILEERAAQTAVDAQERVKAAEEAASKAMTELLAEEGAGKKKKKKKQPRAAASSGRASDDVVEETASPEEVVEVHDAASQDVGCQTRVPVKSKGVSCGVEVHLHPNGR